MSMNTLVSRYHVFWILSISLDSLLHWAAFDRAFVVVPAFRRWSSQTGLTMKHVMFMFRQNSFSYLGFGLFFTIFFPYFLHLKPSSRTSTSDLVLNANLSLTSLSLPLSPTNTIKHHSSGHESLLLADIIHFDS